MVQKGSAFLNKIPDHSDIPNTVRKRSGSEINSPAFGLVMNHLKLPEPFKTSETI